MKHSIATCLVLCFLLLFAGGCTQQASEEVAADSGTQLLEILSIRDKAEEAYAAAMAALEPAEGEPVEGEAVEGEAVEDRDPQQIAEEMQRIEMDREGQYELFTDQLVTYINNNPDSQEAKTAYADYLAKFVAPAFITEMGNYMKAVEVYDEALALDPLNAGIQARRDEAESLKFMTRERFDTITKGMYTNEVEAICGVANPKHIKEEEKRGKTLVGWYYPTADRGAAGIYFQDDQVYNMKFDAIKAPVVKKLGEGEGEGDDVAAEEE
jgi:tetratricopeptide (TPR) repeat protein